MTSEQWLAEIRQKIAKELEYVVGRPATDTTRALAQAIVRRVVCEECYEDVGEWIRVGESPEGILNVTVSADAPYWLRRLLPVEEGGLTPTLEEVPILDVKDQTRDVVDSLAGQLRHGLHERVLALAHFASDSFLRVEWWPHIPAYVVRLKNGAGHKVTWKLDGNSISIVADPDVPTAPDLEDPHA